MTSKGCQVSWLAGRLELELKLAAEHKPVPDGRSGEHCSVLCA